MKKKRSGSSVRGARAGRRGSSIRRRAIDFSDIPEMSDAQLRAMRRVGRPTLGEIARQLIAIRIDPQVLDNLRKEAQQRDIGYQTLINNILTEHAKKKTA
jgi:uncharacterized protein (DUF4415 family)